MEESNKAFNKASLLAEIEAERAKLRQERGPPSTVTFMTSSSGGMMLLSLTEQFMSFIITTVLIRPFHHSISGNRSCWRLCSAFVGVEPAAAYDPSVSIFDTISSEVFDRPEDAQKRREEHHRERDLNKETFGEAPSFHYGRGGRGGRGRGGGQQFARNNNRGPNNDANTRGRQRPQQPQRQPRVRN